MRVLNWCASVVLAFAIVGCGGGGGGGSPQPTPILPTQETTIVVAGQALAKDISLTGALVELGAVDITQTSSIEKTQGKIVSVDIQQYEPVVAEDGTFDFKIPQSLIETSSLYSLSIQCPSSVATCQLSTPLGAIISGERLLKQQLFNVNALTSLIHKKLGIHILLREPGYDTLLNELDYMSNLLLTRASENDAGITYENVLAWNPDSSDRSRLKRQALITTMEQDYNSYDSAQLQKVAESILADSIGQYTGEHSVKSIALQNDLVVTVGQTSQFSSNSVLTVINAQSPQTPTFFGELSLPCIASALEIVGTAAFVVCGGAIQVIDLSNPEEPSLASTVTSSKGVSDISIKDGIAYAAGGPNAVDSGEKLSAYSIAGTQLIYLGGLTSGWWDSASQVATSNNTGVLIGDGLQVVDITNPSVPTALGELTPLSISNISSVEIHENYAFIGGREKIVVVDLSNRDQPKVLSTITTAGSIKSIAVENGRLYATDNAAGLLTFDITRPDMPTLIGSKQTAGEALGIKIHDNTAFIGTLEGQLEIVDIEAPHLPLFRRIDVPGTAYGIAVKDRIAYVSYGDSSIDQGMQAIDTRDENKLQRLDNVYSGANSGRDVAINNNLAFVTLGPDNPFIVDITNPSEFGTLYHGGNMGRGSYGQIEFMNSFAIIASSFGGDFPTQLQVIDLTIPQTPTLVSTMEFDHGGLIKDMKTQNNLAFASYTAWSNTSGDQWSYVPGFEIIDLSETAHPVSVAKFTPSEVDSTIEGFEITPSHAFLARGELGLEILDISNPLTPAHIATTDTFDFAKSVTASGRYAYVADGNAGVQVFDISTPSAPEFFATIPTSPNANRIVNDGDYLYILTDFGLDVMPVIPAP